MLIKINKRDDLKNENIIDAIKNKITFYLFALRSKVNKNKNIFKILFLKSKILNGNVYTYFILYDLDFNEVYTSEPIFVFESSSKNLIRDYRKMNVVDEKFISKIYKDRDFFFKECIKNDLDLFIHFDTLKCILYKYRLTSNDLIMYENIEENKLVKIILKENEHLFCLTKIKY